MPRGAGWVCEARRRLRNSCSRAPRLGTSTGSPKIIDLLAEGTSLRVTQASDFSAYLSRHQYNVHALIEGMRQVVAQIR